jgi:hypothetical protein
MTDRDYAELRALCDLFRREMACQRDPPPFDRESRDRVGELISRAARQGRSDYAAVRGSGRYVTE